MIMFINLVWYFFISVLSYFENSLDVGFLRNTGVTARMIVLMR